MIHLFFVVLQFANPAILEDLCLFLVYILFFSSFPLLYLDTELQHLEGNV